MWLSMIIIQIANAITKRTLLLGRCSLSVPFLFWRVLESSEKKGTGREGRDSSSLFYDSTIASIPQTNLFFFLEGLFPLLAFYIFFFFSVLCCFFDSIHDSFRFVFYSSLSSLSLYWLSTLLSVSLCFCCWNNRTDTPATWCSSMFPNMYFWVKLIYWDSYSYVQQYYWDVGPFHFYSFHHVFFYFFFGRNRSLSSFKPSPFYCWCSIPCLLPLLFILNSNVLPFPLFIDLILLLPFFLSFVILFVLLLPVLWLFISM